MRRKALFRSLAQYIFLFVATLSLIAAVILWWAVGEVLPKRSSLEVAESIDAIPALPKENISIVSYNIGHGQGVKEKAEDYRDKAVTLDHLNKLALAMKKIDADIYLLQEVDLDSKRTHHINQIDFLKEHTGYSYHACAIFWQKNYVPFPYWPPEHHIGYVRSATCVLSRYKLSNHERVVFDKPQSHPFWYNLGYLDRIMQRVDVQVGEQKIALLNVHLEAWEIAAREEQVKVLASYIKGIDLPIILGGDFNTIMPDEPKQSGFVDEPGADYSKENTFKWFLANVPGLKMSTLKPSDNPFERYSFPSNEPTRKLDHLFLLGTSLSFLDFRVAHEAGTASDHLPVWALVSIR